METEIFTLCDHAQDFNGKLVIIGTFDTINSKSFPCIHPNCSIAGRLRFSEKELGTHKFKIRVTDNNSTDIINPLEGEMQINKSQTATFSSINFAITIGQLKFENPGRYSIELYIDNTWETGLPLILVKL